MPIKRFAQPQRLSSATIDFNNFWKSSHLPSYQHSNWYIRSHHRTSQSVTMKRGKRSFDRFYGSVIMPCMRRLKCKRTEYRLLFAHISNEINATNVCRFNRVSFAFFISSVFFFSFTFNWIGLLGRKINWLWNWSLARLAEARLAWIAFFSQIEHIK